MKQKKDRKTKKSSTGQKPKGGTVFLGLLFAALFWEKEGLLAAAEELGGFQVEMGTGENEELPSDWELPEESFAGLTENQENDVPQETDQWNGQIEDQMQETDQWEEQAEDLMQEAGEEQETVVWPEPAEAQEGTDLPFTEEVLSGAAETGEEIRIQQRKIPALEREPTPAPTETISPAPREKPAPSEKPVSKEIQTPFPLPEQRKKTTENQKEEPLGNSRQSPGVIYWNAMIQAGRPVCLQVRSRGKLRVLSLKIDGKECRGSWQDGTLVFSAEERSPAEKKLVSAEAAFLCDGGAAGRGIFIDEKNKP